MAVAFNENEKELIKVRLQTAAEQCLKTYGVKKTTVEELTKIAGISKGAFYIFYKSKEILFFEVMELFQKNTIEELVRNLNKTNKPTKEMFIDGIFDVYKSVKNSFVFNIIQNNEVEYLFRKLPQDLIVNHHSFDDILMSKIFECLRIKEKQNIEIVSASLRAIFMTMLHEQEIGVHYMEVLRVLITGVINETLKGDM